MERAALRYRLTAGVRSLGVRNQVPEGVGGWVGASPDDEVALPGSVLLHRFQRLGDAVQGNLDAVQLTLRSFVPLYRALQVLTEPAQSLPAPVGQQQRSQASHSQNRQRHIPFSHRASSSAA